MKTCLHATALTLGFFAAALFAGFAAEPVNVDSSGVAVKGFDPVAYFTDGKAVKGDKAITSVHAGATYNFASDANKSAFDQDPAKYAPQFGGYCAWAVSQGYTASIDPKAFQIVDGRLLLQYSPSVSKTFAKDTTGNLKKADANWPAVLAKETK